MAFVCKHELSSRDAADLFYSRFHKFLVLHHEHVRTCDGTQTVFSCWWSAGKVIMQAIELDIGHPSHLAQVELHIAGLTARFLTSSRKRTAASTATSFFASGAASGRRLRVVARPALLHAGASALQRGDCSRLHFWLHLHSQPFGSALRVRASRRLGMMTLVCLHGAWSLRCSQHGSTLSGVRRNCNSSMSGLVSAAGGGQTHAWWLSGLMTHNLRTMSHSCSSRAD